MATTSNFMNLYAKDRAQMADGAKAYMTPQGHDLTQQGLDAFGREHIQGDMGAADAALARGNASRGAQIQAQDMYRQAMQGNGPNVARQQLNMGIGNVLEQQGGAMAARPGLGALAVQRQGAAMGQNAVAAAAQQRQNEQGAYAQGMGSVGAQRVQDEQALMGLGLSRAQAQAQLDLQSAQQNMNYGMGLMGAGQNYNILGAQGRVHDMMAGYKDQLAKYGLDKTFKDGFADAESSFNRGVASSFATALGGASAGMGNEPDTKWKWEDDPGYNPQYGF